MKTLVITPMEEEQAFFLKTCNDQGFSAEKVVAGRLPVLELPELELVLAVGGTGKVQFAVQTQHLLDAAIEPDAVICAGASGSLVDYLDVGDVVVATATVEHDIQERFIERPLPRFGADKGLVDSMTAVDRLAFSFPVHFGTVASGDEDIVEADRKRALHQATGGIAVAWEGAGGARACLFSGVPFVEIRGITDSADEDAPSDFEVNLATAMGNIAAFIIAWITSAPTN